MTAIRIETQLDSDTVHLPQLKPFVGKSVEIFVREMAVPVVAPGTSAWADVQVAVRDLENYDSEAWRAMRQAELQR